MAALCKHAPARCGNLRMTTVPGPRYSMSMHEKPPVTPRSRFATTKREDAGISQQTRQQPPEKMVCDARSDALERHLQSCAKQEENMTRQGWMELLDKTIPKLKCRRELRHIHKATRLAYVMSLVGSKRDPPLASRAVAALLVDHWCPDESYAFLQKDAMRHATVAFLRAELRDPWERRNIALQLELGIRRALDGTGLEYLETFPAWSRDHHILLPGGAEQLQEEVNDLASDCREAQSDSSALAILEQYVAAKRLDTFFEDFIEWGRVQLDNVPETMLDEALSEQSASLYLKTARSKAEPCGGMDGDRSNHASGKGGGATSGGESGGASSGGGGGRSHRARPRSTRQPPLGGKRRLKTANGSNSSGGGGGDGGSSSGGSSSGRGKSAGRDGRKDGREDTDGGGGRGKGKGSGRGRSKYPEVNKRRMISSRVATAPAKRPVRGRTTVTEIPEREAGAGMGDKALNLGSRESASGSSSSSGSSSGARSGARSRPRSSSRIDSRSSPRFGSGSGPRSVSRSGSRCGSRSGPRLGSRSVTAPAHVNGSDYSEFYADCRRDGSGWPADRSSESEEEGDEEAYPRSRKPLKTSVLKARVAVGGKEDVGTEGKARRKAAVAARNKMQARAGGAGDDATMSVRDDGISSSTRELKLGTECEISNPEDLKATVWKRRGSGNGGLPKRTTSSIRRRIGCNQSLTIRGSATFRMGNTDEGIPASRTRRLLQVVHAVTRDGGDVSGYFDRQPEVIASLRELALADLKKHDLALETSESEFFLRTTFKSALRSTGRPEFLPLVRYVLQECYEGPDTMTAEKIDNLLSSICRESYIVAEEFPRFSFVKLPLSVDAVARVAFVIKKR